MDHLTFCCGGQEYILQPFKTSFSPFVDPPSPPVNPKFILHSFSYVVLSWSSFSDFTCVASNYAVTLTNITEGNTVYVYNTTTNTTSITVSDLAQGAEYFFTVAGIDTGGRVGEKSMSSTFLMFNSECSWNYYVHITFTHQKCTNLCVISFRKLW